MTTDFPYEPGYIGELDTFSPQITSDLERLLKQLDPLLNHEISENDIPYFRNDARFRQIVAVEELEGRPAIVGTANISFVQHSYDKDGHLTDIPCAALGSFVVDENVRGKGVAGRIWNGVLDVCKAQNIHIMQFTSKPTRSAAHGFYAKMGAEQFTPIKAVKYKADESIVVERDAIPCDEQLELAKGHVVFVFSEADAEPIDEITAQYMMSKYETGRFEQLIPTNNADEATTVLFSVSF